MDVERKKYRESIRVELISWGFDFSNIGTQEFLEIIDFICNQKDYKKFFANLEEYVYKEVAKALGKNYYTLKSNITKVTRKVYEEKCLENKKNRYKSMGPKTVISNIVYKLRTN